MLHTKETKINMLRDTIEMIRGGAQEATSSKQNAKRRQRAGRLNVDGLRQENNVRKICGYSKALMGSDRFKRESVIHVLAKRIQRKGIENPNAESRERVSGVSIENPKGFRRSRGN